MGKANQRAHEQSCDADGSVPGGNPYTSFDSACAPARTCATGRVVGMLSGDTGMQQVQTTGTTALDLRFGEALDGGGWADGVDNGRLRTPVKVKIGTFRPLVHADLGFA